jgi:cellulose synthase/poly-beta-1,6-N-acetylglucosamine synthase-like glycosyltransferase
MNGTALGFVGIILLVAHLSIPLGYYSYLKKKWFTKEWDLAVDKDYKPMVTVIVPTYNEEAFIAKRLKNITEQRYPKELLHVMVVDSNSTDGTVQEVAGWQEKSPGNNVRLVREPDRKGKMHAIQRSLKEISTPFIMIGDADSLWDESAVSNTMKYFADPSVCVVTASLKYLGKTGAEDTYRHFYNVLTVAESKRHSTPLQSGVLQAIRMEFIDKFGLPLYSGSEDCAIASYVAFRGFRAIRADDVWAYEPLRGGRLRTKVRRAQHNLLNFLLMRAYVRKKASPVRSRFDLIWRVQWYLYVVNPWVLIVSVALTLWGAVALRETLALAMLLTYAIVLSVSKRARSWVLQQVYLALALIRTLYKRPVTW